MSTLIPTIKWSQNNDYIIVNLEINQAKNDVYEINNNYIVFTGVCNTDLKYGINLELLNEINKEESKYLVEERFIRFILKKTSDEKWIRLTKDKNQYKSNIKVNWDSFEDSDEEDQEDTQSQYPSNQQFDFSNMMNMDGGNNGFNMEEMMKNMDPYEMAQLMKSMNMEGNDDDNTNDDNSDDNNSDDDNTKDDNSDDDNTKDDDYNNESDNYNNDAYDNDENKEFDDKELEDELNNIINNDEDNESIDSDDLCQDCA
jgi:hypothetical protein